MIGPDLVFEAMEKVRLIRERLKSAQSRQKSYSDNKRKDLEFNVDDWVYLKISPMKGVMRFGKKGKLSPRYIGPYKIFTRVEKVAYELNLPNDFAMVHLVFNVSMLTKFIGDENIIVPLHDVTIEENLSYEEVLVEILDR